MSTGWNINHTRDTADLECFIAEGVSFQCSLVPLHGPAVIFKGIIDLASQEAESRVVADLLARCSCILVLLRRVASFIQNHICSSSLT